MLTPRQKAMNWWDPCQLRWAKWARLRLDQRQGYTWATSGATPSTMTPSTDSHWLGMSHKLSHHSAFLLALHHRMVELILSTHKLDNTPAFLLRRHKTVWVTKTPVQGVRPASNTSIGGAAVVELNLTAGTC
ncbi:unnamed protein product [Gadus morhua 'NCC']